MPIQYERRIMVTGGAGFIGSNLLLYLVPRYPEYLFVNVDALTYAGNLSNLKTVEGAENYRFEKLDITDCESVTRCFAKYDIDGLIHLAAESHVDRSIIGPAEFIQSNIVGTFNLLEAARAVLTESGEFRFHQVSTDEVYGSLGDNDLFSEDSPYRPNSPYAASKAAADHLVRAYCRTYGLDAVTSNSSNNFGPFQFPEKLIPLMIVNGLSGKELPVYGDGQQVRDWLYVQDHCEAIDLVFHKGAAGQTYCIGARNEIANIDLVHRICQLLDETTGGGAREKLIKFVSDRPGHDRRYGIDPSRIEGELGWGPRHSFDEGLRNTVEWYRDHGDWLEACMSGDYQEYYRKVYGDR